MKKIRIIKSNICSVGDETTPKDLNQTGTQIISETIKVLEKAKVQFSMAVQNSKDDPVNQKIYLKNQRTVEHSIELLKKV